MKRLFFCLLWIIGIYPPVLVLEGQTPVITLDGNGTGRVFEGIGAVSAGASSRLLIDYPEPYRSQILDYLFKPNYGANIQHLKIELGGDVDSTAGAEPSHMHTFNDLNLNRGYEWWLMQQAKLRNPNMTFGALAWGAPGWIGGGAYYSQDNIDYIISFIKGAQSHYGITIGDIGIWNESGYNISWIISLKNALLSEGLSTLVVAADQSSLDIVADMINNPSLASAVDVVGMHYPTDPQPFAIPGNKRVWATEAGPWRGDWIGAQYLAKIYNRYYFGKITRTEVWSPITSYYDFLPTPHSGLMYANTPWSGSYEVQPAIWATAHTTQFAQPGWQYIDSACAKLINGSLVTLKNGSDYSVIAETIDASTSQNITFRITDGLSTSAVHVWKSNATTQFIQQSDVVPVNGTYTISLDPGSIYSITTTTGQSKGTATPPRPAAFPFPYSDDFEAAPVDQTAKYFSTINGSFEIAPCGGGRSGQCLRQAVSQPPIAWHEAGPAEPASFIGSTGWTNYQITSDVFLEEPGTAKLIGRLTSQDINSGDVGAYQFYVSSNGSWQLCVHDSVVLASGLAPFPINVWHTVSFVLNGPHLQGIIDGATVADIYNYAFPNGMAGLGVRGWTRAQFDNFRIDLAPGANPIVPQAQITATATSAAPSNPPGNAVDGYPSTYWQTNFTCTPTCQLIDFLPQSITLNLGGSYAIDNLRYLPRQDNAAGAITSFNIYVSNDGETFSLLTSGNWSGDTTEKRVSLGSALASYIRLEAIAGVGGYAAASEINVELPTPANGPSPTITALSPSSTSSGGAGFTLTVTGNNFTSQSEVLWNGAARPTTFISSSSLTASIGSSDIANVGSANVTVFTPAPGGVSNMRAFSINQGAASGGGGSPQTATLLTGYALNAPSFRNDFGGWVGMQFTVGSNPMYVSGLGRLCVAGNSQIHNVKLVDASTANDVPGGFAAVNMSGCARGQFVYAALPFAITLTARASYYLVTAEVAGGDQWYDSGQISTTVDAAVTNAVYFLNGSWYPHGASSTSYVPPNLQYSLTAPETSGAATAPTFSLPGGAYSSTQTVALSDDTPGTTIYYTTDGTTPNASSAAYTAPISVGTTTTINAFAVASGYAPSSISTAKYNIQTQSSPGMAFVTGSNSQTALRNDFSGWVGMKITVGSNPLYVSTIGRICIAGNRSAHNLKFVDANSGTDVPGASTQLNMNGCTPGTFSYAPLPATVVLRSGGSFYLVSQEAAGGDRWYDFGPLTTTSDAVVNYSVYLQQGSWRAISGPNSSYVPLNFQYSLSQGQPQTGTPTFSTTDGTFNAPVSLSIASSTPDAAIYYTIDGSAPTTTSTVYSGPITISSTTTVNAIAVAPDLAPSAPASVTITIQSQLPQTPIPAFSPAGGIYTSPQTLILSDPGATIYYTTDQSIPTVSSAVYSAPIPVNSTMTVKAIAVAPGLSQSAVASSTYTISSGQNATGFVTGYALGGQDLRTDFSGWVGMKFTVGANALNVVSVGRLCITGNSAVHTVELVNSNTGAALTGGAAQVNMSGCNPGQFVSAQLPTPITLSAGASYYLASQETIGGDKWYDLGPISTTVDAASNSSVYSFNGSNWITIGAAGTSYVPSTFSYTFAPADPNPPFVSAFNLSHPGLRQDYSGWVGMKLIIGPAPVNVSYLGRVCITGNSATHTIKFVNAASGNDIPGGSAPVNMNGCTPGEFVYTALPTSILLPNGSSYYLVSQESAGGDVWYDIGAISVRSVATVSDAVYSYGSNWNVLGGVNSSYVPPSFK